MADTATSKIDAAAEKAYAEAAAAKKVEAEKVEKAVEADKKPAVKAKAVKKAVAKKAPAKKVAAKKAAPKKAAAKKAPAKKAVAKKATTKKVGAKKAASKKAVAAKKAAPATTVSKLKDTIMATDTKKITEAAKEFAADAQTRLKGAYTKGTEFAGDVAEFNKANLEAVVASGKVLASGMQTMAREGFEDTKKAAEQVREDVKLVAAVKSPTEFVKLQGDFARRNFDAAVAYSSKSTEAWLKLANEAFAPISSRYSEAAEKFSKAA